MADRPAYLIVARIVAPFGIHGEVKADVWTDFPERLADRTTVFLGREDEEPRLYAIRGVRFHGERLLLSLVGCDDRATAESLRGLYVQIPAGDAPALPEGTYYLYQIIGMEVWGSDGALYGMVAGILSTASNDVYIVEGERGQFLVPALSDFVRHVDLEHNRMVVDIDRI